MRLLTNMRTPEAYATRKVCDPYFLYFFQDPVASALSWLQFSTWLAGSWRQVGK